MSTNSNRLPFYKPPQQNTNQYKFENADLDRVAVVQRFKNRNPPQVTQGSRADQAGIKLGDTIVKINDTETKNMSLAEAHQRIQDSGNDIKLTVKSFEEDEANENEQHEIAMAKKKENDRAALEEKLRAMKMRLAQIAEIPLIIQSTLESVSKTFEGFLPPEPEPQIEIERNSVENDDDIISIDSLDSDSKERNQEFEDDAIRSELSLSISEYSKSDEPAKDDFLESQHETTPEVEPTEEQILKMEKQMKMQELERSWPWADQQKKVYKRSNYQIAPSSSLIQNRIKQLNEQQLISFYKNEHRID